MNDTQNTPALTMDELMAAYGNIGPVVPKRGSLIQGTVFRVDPKLGAWIDFGGKTDALVPTDEIGDAELIAGQKTTFVVLTSPEDDEFVQHSKQWNGPVFSARRARAWTSMQEAAESKSTVTVKVTRVKRYNRGPNSGSIAGVEVVANGIGGFVPYSMLGVGGNSIDKLVGSEIEAKVAQVDPEARKLTFNHREVVAEKQAETQRRREELFASLSVGDIRTGKVVRVVDYGCFVDVGEGLHGLVHRSELSNDSKAPVADLVKVGDELPVKVLRAETVEGKRQLALSAKQVRQQAFLNSVQIGDILTGTVSRLTAFGCFVELSDEHGVDGLIHKSQFSSAVRNGRKELVEGEAIRVKVIELDTAKGRIGLTLKEVAQPRATEAESSDSSESGPSA